MKLLVLALLVVTGRGQAAPALCLGPKDAASRFIYLHGMDDEKPTAQELENRRLLGKLAESLSMRVAVVRGNHRCKGKVCWKQDTPQEVTATYEALRRDAGACFDSSKPLGLLGFSNGGYLAGKIAFHCLTPKPEWVVVVGSAGTVKADASLAQCAPVTVLMGERDMTLEKARRFHKDLASRGALTRFETFKGGHEFKEDVLKRILQAPVPPRKATR